VPGGIGVHLTGDIAGQARFGPDLDADYSGDPRRADSFYGRDPALFAARRRFARWIVFPAWDG
jgi:hypothetical protein